MVQKEEIEKEQELAKKETKWQKLDEEQRIIREKTETITQANKHIDEKTNQYRVLTKQASADKEEEASCQALIDLLKSIYDTNVNKTLSGYKNFAEIVHKKCEIRAEVEKVARLYVDIGKSTAANELIGRLKQ